MRSGEWDRWADAAADRMDALALDAPFHLAYHVELPVVAMMIDSRTRQAEVVINNSPCGFESRPIGCHQVLGRVLPDGYRLTVPGTTRAGKPFRQTYVRQGPISGG